MIYFTSDTHYFHENVIKYSKRPFKDAASMTSILADNWNHIVQPNDTVYHLGDVSFGDASATDKILQRLNGDIKLCYGNHDRVIKKNKSLQDRFSEIRDYYEIKIDAEPHLIVACHYPMVVWNKSHHGSFMIHGHSHGNLKYPMKARIMDVGVDPCGYFPISLDKVKKHMATLTSDILDHHGSTTNRT